MVDLCGPYHPLIYHLNQVQFRYNEQTLFAVAKTSELHEFRMSACHNPPKILPLRTDKDIIQFATKTSI